jgi:hypothetical protein
MAVVVASLPPDQPLETDNSSSDIFKNENIIL